MNQKVKDYGMMDSNSTYRSFNYGGEDLPWDRWVSDQGIPVYGGHSIYDLNSIELMWWELWSCNAAFVRLVGQEGICETKVTELPPGEASSDIYFAVDELVYVLKGQGSTDVWTDRSERVTVDWSAHSLFAIPRHTWRSFRASSTGSQVRLLHYNYLPLAMSAVPEFDHFSTPSLVGAPSPIVKGLFSEAEEVEKGARTDGGQRTHWRGNIFRDLPSWKGLEENEHRGAKSLIGRMSFPSSELTAHLSVFPERTYKKAHRHGPGRLIVIPAGRGYSVIWPEEGEKAVLPWQTGSILVPPDRWFHQHFNIGSQSARYLALHPPRQFGGYAANSSSDQIEYADEDPWIRDEFERQLGAAPNS